MFLIFMPSTTTVYVRRINVYMIIKRCLLRIYNNLLQHSLLFNNVRFQNQIFHVKIVVDAKKVLERVFDD